MLTVKYYSGRSGNPQTNADIDNSSNVNNIAAAIYTQSN